MFSLKTVLNRQTGSSFLEALPDNDPQTVVWMPEGDDSVTVETFVGSEAEAQFIRDQWRDMLDGAGLNNAELVIAPVRETDWATEWRLHFKCERITERLLVCPDWEAYTPKPGEVVVRTNPGMSFGTGRHATTRACLKFLDACRAAREERPSFLDIGCGSGILSVAAALLDCGSVTAIDNDPRALTDTLENSRRNGVDAKVKAFTVDLEDFQTGCSYDVVAANLLSGILIQHARKIAALVACEPAGDLLIAGILNEQYPAVKTCYQALGFEEVAAVADGEWRSGRLRRK